MNQQQQAATTLLGETKINQQQQNKIHNQLSWTQNKNTLNKEKDEKKKNYVQVEIGIFTLIFEQTKKKKETNKM